MNKYLQQNNQIFVLGLGVSGQSCLTYLSKKAKVLGLKVVASDTKSINNLTDLKEKFPLVNFIESNIQESINESGLVVASPGISLKNDYLVNANNAGVDIVGDIELFAQEVKTTNTPVIAITGSNGKSTVTDLLDKILSVKFNVACGGNIGTPALSLLDKKQVDIYILELSSFQLETTKALQLLSACIVNITPDHMDRYDSFDDYKNAKLSIYRQTKNISYCRDDILMQESINEISSKLENVKVNTFALSEPSNDSEYGIRSNDGSNFIAKGLNELINVKKVGLQGNHNWLNIMAAYGLLENVYHHYEKDFSKDLSKINDVIANYPGLAHRCEKVLLQDNILWINDSKATNPESTMAALLGFSNTQSKNIVWVVGGEGKGADFSPLKTVIDSVKAIILFGRDSKLIAQTIDASCPLYEVSTMDDVITNAKKISQAGDVVLFSPACASFDMFNNFEHRGDVFKAMVNEKVAV